ncbi:hypothetical protein BC829DRAFT_271006 [Chytridium lagenaria]|nr:hypothetical protein BC829DRAFT_271006 [Chytridium lagenaria]
MTAASVSPTATAGLAEVMSDSASGTASVNHHLETSISSQTLDPSRESKPSSEGRKESDVVTVNLEEGSEGTAPTLNNSGSPSGSLYYPTASLLSPRMQKVYTGGYLGVNAFVASIISGVLGYYISYALYGVNNPPPNLYRFDGTFPGDLIVTLIIQNFITWITTSISVFLDLRNARALPVAPPKFLIPGPNGKPRNRIQRAYQYFTGPSKQADVLAPKLPKGERSRRVRSLLSRAILSSLIVTPLHAIIPLIVVYAVYTKNKDGVIPRIEAFWIKAAIGAVYGAFHTVVVGLMGLWSVDPVFGFTSAEGANDASDKEKVKAGSAGSGDNQTWLRS